MCCVKRRLKVDAEGGCFCKLIAVNYTGERLAVVLLQKALIDERNLKLFVQLSTLSGRS